MGGESCKFHPTGLFDANATVGPPLIESGGSGNMGSVVSCKGYALRNKLSALVHGSGKQHGFSNQMPRHFAVFHDEDLQPVILNNIP